MNASMIDTQGSSCITQGEGDEGHLPPPYAPCLCIAPEVAFRAATVQSEQGSRLCEGVRGVDDSSK